MSVENVKKFLEDVKADKELAAKIDQGEKAADYDAKINALTAVANANGYNFTVAELKEAAIENEELSLDELENVSGGGNCVAFASGNCTCFGDGGHCTCFGDGCIAVFI